MFKDTSFDDSVVENCNFEGSKFRGKWMMGYGGRRVKFVNCNFNLTEFKQVEFRATEFINCSFVGAKFEKSLFCAVKFTSGAPEEAQFEKSDVQRSFIDLEEFKIEWC